MSMSLLPRQDIHDFLQSCGRCIMNVPSSKGFQRQSIVLIKICRILEDDESFLRWEGGVETSRAKELRSVISKTSLVLNPKSEGKPDEYIKKAVNGLYQYVRKWPGSEDHMLSEFDIELWMREAKQKDQVKRSLYESIKEKYKPMKDDSAVAVDVVVVSTPQQDTPYIHPIPGRLSHTSTFNEVLWFMRNFKTDLGPITLDHRPHFYTTNPREYRGIESEVKPAKVLQDCLGPKDGYQKLYAVLDSGHHVVLDARSKTFVFGNMFTDEKNDKVIVLKDIHGTLYEASAETFRAEIGNSPIEFQHRRSNSIHGPSQTVTFDWSMAVEKTLQHMKRTKGSGEVWHLTCKPPPPQERPCLARDCQDSETESTSRVVGLSPEPIRVLESMLSGPATPTPIRGTDWDATGTTFFEDDRSSEFPFLNASDATLVSNRPNDPPKMPQPEDISQTFQRPSAYHSRTVIKDASDTGSTPTDRPRGSQGSSNSATSRVVAGPPSTNTQSSSHRSNHVDGSLSGRQQTSVTERGRGSGLRRGVSPQAHSPSVNSVPGAPSRLSANIPSQAPSSSTMRGAPSSTPLAPRPSHPSVTMHSSINVPDATTVGPTHAQRTSNAQQEQPTIASHVRSQTSMPESTKHLGQVYRTEGPQVYPQNGGMVARDSGVAGLQELQEGGTKPQRETEEVEAGLVGHKRWSLRAWAKEKVKKYTGVEIR